MGLTSTFLTLTRLSRRLSTEWCKFLNLHGDAALQDIVGIPRIGTLNQFKSRKSDSLKSFWSNKFEVWVFWRGSKRFKVWFGWTNLDLIVFDLFSSKQVRNSLFQQIFQHYVYVHYVEIGIFNAKWYQCELHLHFVSKASHSY